MYWIGIFVGWTANLQCCFVLHEKLNAREAYDEYNMDVYKRSFYVKFRRSAACPQIPERMIFTLLYETPLPVASVPCAPEKTEMELVWDAVQEWFAVRGEPVPEEERRACLELIAKESYDRLHPHLPPPPQKKPPKKFFKK